METFNEHENHNKLLDLIAEMALHNLELSFEHPETTTLTTIKQSLLPIFIDLDSKDIESNNTKEKNLPNNLSAAFLTLSMLDTETFLVIQPEENKPIIIHKILISKS